MALLINLCLLSLQKLKKKNKNTTCIERKFPLFHGFKLMLRKQMLKSEVHLKGEIYFKNV